MPSRRDQRRSGLRRQDHDGGPAVAFSPLPGQVAVSPTSGTGGSVTVPVTVTGLAPLDSQLTLSPAVRR